MEASVFTMPPALGHNKHAADTIPNLKDNNNNNAESRMNTSSKNNALTLDDARVANESRTKPISSNHNSQETQNSQSTVEEINEATTASTPPTSDGFSSQSQESQLSQLSAIAAAREPLDFNGADPAPASFAMASTAGQKRTASGMVKPATAKSPTEPAVERNGGHVRSMSNISSTSSLGSKIGEVRNALF